MSSLVYHDKEPRFGLNETPRTWPDDFDLVANLDIDDLDAIFELTNHVTGDWTKNPQVKWSKTDWPEDGPQKGCRSTSVGDIIVTSNEEVYLVLPVGWESLGKSDRKITLQPRNRLSDFGIGEDYGGSVGEPEKGEK